MGFIKELKRGLAGEGVDDGYALAGKRFVCPHCSGDQFAEGRAQLNTAGMTFLGLDWANPSAYTLACRTCGLVSWFLIEPERIP